jgi:histidyl-tRNA synthetase
MEINLVPDSEFEDFNISIGGGGRYDNLIGMFGKEQIPACGFSLGLERILVVMEERGMFQKLIEEGKLNLNSADLLIACFDEQLIGDCLKLAEELRRQDLCVSVYPEAKQNAKPYKYAEQINASFVCLVRENEWAENKVTLKNMRTGEQETIDKASVVDKIRI